MKNKDSNFLKAYVKDMTDVMQQMNPSWDKKDIKKIVWNMVEEQGCNPEVILDNNYTGERRETTLLSVLDWAMDRKPIICGNATFYKNQHEAINPIAKMLEDFLTQRKIYKKQMFSIEDSTSPEYKDLDRSQVNEKTNSNSYYGASGAKSSAFYSEWSGPATTHTAQQVISTTKTLFEGFLVDNYYFLNLTECIEWISTIISPFLKEEKKVDEFITKKSIYNVHERLMSKILEKEEEDDSILLEYLSYFNEELLSVIYYKNNLIQFIKDHENIQLLILNIFDNVENLDYCDISDKHWIDKIPRNYRKDFIDKSAKEWNKFVNRRYFMDPNDVPDTIKDELKLLSKYLKKYIYCQYLSVDRIYRLRNFKRKVVTVIDTDSNILSVDTLVNYIFDEVTNHQSFGRDKEFNIYICVNMIAFVLTDVVNDILLKYGENSNVPEEFRAIYNMKNEFLFLRLVIGKTKKRYISKVVLREGNRMNPPKYDIKGFDFKKATTSEYSEEVYMNLIKKHIINSENIELRDILIELKQFKQEVYDSIANGDRKFLPNISAKEFGAYKNPYSQQSVKAVMSWNLLNPENTIDLPSKVSVLKLNIFEEKDIEPLKEVDEEKYNLIIDKIFNDTTGIFVQKSWDPGISVVNKKDSKWYNNIPSKYRTKYKKLGVNEWNKFAEEHLGEYSGQWLYKKVGMQVIAIPSNSTIPDWLQPYIDYSTIVNNIIAPFIPVLEIFQSRIIEEGKTRNGVNRKTKAISNIVKF